MPKTLLEVFDEHTMLPWIAGIKAGIREGNTVYGRKWGNNYGLNTNERRQWQDGFAKGCEISSQSVIAMEAAISDEKTRRINAQDFPD